MCNNVRILILDTFLVLHFLSLSFGDECNPSAATFSRQGFSYHIFTQSNSSTFETATECKIHEDLGTSTLHSCAYKQCKGYR